MPVVSMRPLGVDHMGRMVHRGLPGANTPMPRWNWPTRGGAATIPL
jgi:hypothetical protein